MTHNQSLPEELIPCEREEIPEFNEFAKMFFKDILCIDYDNVFLTDASTLSDFSLSGPIPESLLELELTAQELDARWNEWVLAHVKERYGMAPQSTEQTFVAIFSQLSAAQSNRFVH